MIQIDFTKAETFRKLAELPYYGYAESLIRRIDPWWKVELPHVWIVLLERGQTCPHCGCDCGTDAERKRIEVSADSAEEAMDEAERLHPSWIAAKAELPFKPATADVPEQFMKWFEV